MDLNQFSLLFSAGAILFAGLSYFQTSKLDKRNLRISKLEEMLEILHVLCGNYKYFIDTLNFKQKTLQAENGICNNEEYQLQVRNLTKISQEIDLEKKLPRLYVLCNSYLPKKQLKEKIEILIVVFTCLVENTVVQSRNEVNLVFNNFPKCQDFMDFTEEIQNELIKEMKLGYKNNISSRNTYEKQFKERYNL